MKRISRRALISQASVLGAGFAVATTPSAETAASTAEQGRKAEGRRKIIVAGGHPGDPEYGCGGAVARWTASGNEVVLLYLNRGDPAQQPGQPGKDLRVREAEKACAILAARPVFAGQIDGKAVVDSAQYDAFRTLLEAEQPHAVFTHWPIDNHADHRAIYMLVYEAWLRMKRSFALCFYEVSNGEDTLQFAPTHYVDITEVESRKRAACYAHASQAPDKFYGLQSLVSRWRGVERGCGHAEAFIRHVQSPAVDLPLLT